MHALFERHELLHSHLSGKTRSIRDKRPTSDCAFCIELSTFALATRYARSFLGSVGIGAF